MVFGSAISTFIHNSRSFRIAYYLVTSISFIIDFRRSQGCICRSRVSTWSLLTSRILLMRCSIISPQFSVVCRSSSCYIVRVPVSNPLSTSMLQSIEFSGFRNSWDIAAMKTSFIFSEFFTFSSSRLRDSIITCWLAVASQIKINAAMLIITMLI